MSPFCDGKIKSPLYVVFVGVWITTAGTVYNDLARRIGKAVQTIMRQSGSSYKKSVLIGFTKLRNVRKREELREKSRDVTAADHKITHDEVRRRLLLRT